MYPYGAADARLTHFEKCRGIRIPLLLSDSRHMRAWPSTRPPNSPDARSRDLRGWRW